jgi:DNA-directed RNA polymerase specialized sigma24 family protein
LSNRPKPVRFEKIPLYELSPTARETLREIYVLHAEGGLSYGEIAELRGIPLWKVTARMRALRAEILTRSAQFESGAAAAAARADTGR